VEGIELRAFSTQPNFRSSSTKSSRVTTANTAPPAKMPSFTRDVLARDDGTMEWIASREESQNGNFLTELGLYLARHSLDIALTTLLFVTSLPIEHLPGVERLFRLDDPSIANSHLSDTVPVFAVFILLIPIPITIIFIYTAGHFGPEAIRHRRSAANFFFPLLGLLTTCAISSMLTNVLKVTVGRLRPDFLDRCKPLVDPPSPALQLGMVKWYNATICTSHNDLLIRAGRTSFPSGHTTDSFAGMMYLSLFLYWNLFLLPAPWPVMRDGPAKWSCASFGLTTPSFLLITTPVAVATWVGVSRISDHRHNPSDVLAGALIGTLSAALGWFLWGIRGYRDVRRRELLQGTTASVGYSSLDDDALLPGRRMSIQLEDEDEQGHAIGSRAAEVQV